MKRNIKQILMDIVSVKDVNGKPLIDFTPVIISNLPWKYSLSEGMRYYMWLCQLQKCLIDKYHIYVYCLPVKDKYTMKWTNNLGIRESPEKIYDTYQSALEHGLYSAILENDLLRNNQKS